MFENLTPDQIQQLAIVIALAILPTVIWSIVIFKGRKSARGPLFLAFFLGTLTVLPIMGLNYLWIWFPDLDVYKAIEENITEIHAAAFITLVVVGVIEEFVKSLVVRFIDKSRIPVATVNDAVKYSILAGLGFAFTENIFYFYYIWVSSGFAGLIFPLVFRSVFTVCAHMVFSGIFGYYYGLAKFSSPIMETELWMGEKKKGVQIMSKIMGLGEAKAYKQVLLIKGLGIAMIIHAFFNFFLEFQQLLYTVILVVLGFMYLLYLLAHKAGAIAFAGMGRKSSMVKKDEDVVVELLGMWTNEGRYKDVIDICQRLLMRDPDNKVVQLFQAKAMDKQKLANVENSFGALFKENDSKEQDKSLRTLVKQKVLMEMLKEKQSAPPPATAPPAQTPAPQSGPSSPPSSPAPPAPGPSLPKPSGAKPSSEEDPQA